MKILFLFLAMPALAFSAPHSQPSSKPAENSAKETAKATVQMLSDVQNALNIVSEAATQCYDVKVANPSGKSYLLSDSLVKNLSCAQLNPATVFRSLQPDAFSPEHQMQIRNWPSNGIANCWALALAQRQIFYFTRFNSHSATSDLAGKIIGMAGGEMPGDTVNNPEPNLKGNAANIIYNPLFRAQIEKRQHEVFYNFSNLGYIMGSRERGESDNRESIATIVNDVKKGRMPAIILRADQTAQHVVLVKSVKKTGPDSYQLTVYDSNQPAPYGAEPTVDFIGGQFYAPRVVGLFHENGTSPIGLFVTHEEEMDKIQDVVFTHYAELCRKVKALEKDAK